MSSNSNTLPSKELHFWLNKLAFTDASGNPLSISSLIFFENLQLLEIQIALSKRVRPLAGVYCILNKKNGKFYIGRASSGYLYNRFSRHLIQKRGSKLLADVLNNGFTLEDFAFILLAPFTFKISKANISLVIEQEQFYLTHYNPPYNILREADSLRHFNHSPESKQKIGQSSSLRSPSPETREKLRRLFKGREGKPHSPETIEKIREAAKKRMESLATRNKIRQALRGRKKDWSKLVSTEELEGLSAYVANWRAQTRLNKNSRSFVVLLFLLASRQ